jgi:DNA gyrase subunit B
MADEEIFGQVEFHYEIIAKRLRELSFLNNGVKIRLVDQRTARKKTLPFSAASRGFVEYINRSKTVYCTRTSSTPPGESLPSMGAISVEVAMQWNDSYAEQVLCFHQQHPAGRRRNAHDRLARGDDARHQPLHRRNEIAKKAKVDIAATTCVKAWPVCCRSRCLIRSLPRRPR